MGKVMRNIWILARITINYIITRGSEWATLPANLGTLLL